MLGNYDLQNWRFWLQTRFYIIIIGGQWLWNTGSIIIATSYNSFNLRSTHLGRVSRNSY